RGVKLFFFHLNPWRIVSNRGLVPADRPVAGSTVPGIALLVAWVASVAVAWRAKLRPLLRVDGGDGAALAPRAFSMVKISGAIWYSLTLWAWGTTLLTLGAVIATVVLVVAPRLPSERAAMYQRVGIGALAVALVVSAACFVDSAAYTAVPNVPVN